MACLSTLSAVKEQKSIRAPVCQNTTLSILVPAVRTLPMPGVRCPTCAANGQEVWVIPGRACAHCEKVPPP